MRAAPEPWMQLHWHFPSLADNQSTFFPKLAWVLVIFKQVSPAQHSSFLLTFMPSSPSLNVHVLPHNCSSGQISQPWICITGIPSTFPSHSLPPPPSPVYFPSWTISSTGMPKLETQLLFTSSKTYIPDGAPARLHILLSPWPLPPVIQSLDTTVVKDLSKVKFSVAAFGAYVIPGHCASQATGPLIQRGALGSGLTTETLFPYPQDGDDISCPCQLTVRL